MSARSNHEFPQGAARLGFRGRSGRGLAGAAITWAFLLLQFAIPNPAHSDGPTHTLTFIHLNDLHANLVPHNDLVRVVPDDGGPAVARVEERGGIARIATLVGWIRAGNPDAILMNIGDTYHGGVEALYTRGNAVAPAVNALGIDVGVPGNWDYAYGAATTRMRYSAEPSLPARFINWLFWGDDVARPNFPNLAANLTQTMPPFSRGELLMPGTLVRDVSGVRIGFIGLTSDMVARMAPPFAWGFDFLQGEGNYRALINESAAGLRAEGAEVVVVMSELGLHRDRRLAEIIQPGVDIFFSAHTHEVTPIPLESASGAVVVEAGNDGYLGRMDVQVRDGAVSELEWSVIPVDASVPNDPVVQELVDEARAPFLAEDVDLEFPAPWVELPLTRPIDTVVGHVDRLLHRRDVLHNPFNAMLAEVIRRAAGTQIGMTPGFRFDAVIPPAVAGGASGEITLEQIYRYLPIAPSIATGKVRGETLRGILELELTRVFSEDPFQHSGGWFGGFGGLDFEIDISRADGERIQSMRLMGSSKPIGDDEILTVASCVRPFDEDNIMCSNPGYTDVEEIENPATGRAWTPLEFLVSAFETGAAPVPSNSRVVDRSGEKLWPEGLYIQPLRPQPPNLKPMRSDR